MCSSDLLFTRARKLSPEQVQGRTQLYADGGLVSFVRDIDAMRYELMRKQ